MSRQNFKRNNPVFSGQAGQVQMEFLFSFDQIQHESGKTYQQKHPQRREYWHGIVSITTHLVPRCQDKTDHDSIMNSFY
jgi:hypothetical protein